MITKELIIETASELFLKNGVKTVTLERIAKEMHTSKRTIYNHFEDKNELLRACIQMYYAQVRKENEEVISKANNAIEAIGHINFFIIKRASLANPNFFYDILTYYPKLLKEAYRDNGHFAHENFTALAKWGIRDGLFLQDMDIDVTMKTVQFLLDLTRDTDKFPVDQYSKNRLTFGIMLPYLRGMCTVTGIRVLEEQKNLFGVNV